MSALQICGNVDYFNQTKLKAKLLVTITGLTLNSKTSWQNVMLSVQSVVCPTSQVWSRNNLPMYPEMGLNVFNEFSFGFTSKTKKSSIHIVCSDANS